MKLKGFVVAGLSVAFVCSAADNPRFTVVDEIVAKVNGDIVSRDELERSARDSAQELKAQGATGPKFEDAYNQRTKDSLRDRIDELLLTQKGKELNINVDSDLSKYVAGLQRDSGITDPEKFHEYVRQQSGQSFEDFQSEAKNHLLTRDVIGREVASHINVSQAEIQDYYDKHKTDFIREEKVFLSEVLISTKDKNAAGLAAAEKKAKQVGLEASRGERFTDLARDNSDSTTAKQGGELGGYKKGELMSKIEEAVWSLPKGGVTKPITTDNGFLILKVDDHTKAGQAALADVQPQIQEVLYGPKMQPKVREYLTGLRKTAFLQVRPGYTDSGAAPGQNTKWEDPAQLKPETITKAEVQDKMRRKRLFGVVPIPGTQTTMTGKSTSR